MKSFEYYNPVRLVFGDGEISKLGELTQSYKKVMVLYGGGSVLKNGVMDQVKEGLKNCQINVFSGIEPNPDYSTCLKAAEQYKKEGCDFLLAVGGGSVLDAVKFIAAVVPFSGVPQEILDSGGSLIQKAEPFGAVLTLPATGSEMNSGSVISRRELKDKTSFHSPHVFPKFSILDPKTTYSLPFEQVSNGIVDAMVHVFEQYLTYPVKAEVQDRMAEAVLLTLVREGACVKDNLQNYACRANIMFAATMALNDLLRLGVPEDWTTHLLGHYLTAKCGMAHGRSLSALLPAVLREMKEEKKEKLTQMGRRVFQIQESEEASISDRTIEALEHFFKQLDMPINLQEAGVTEDLSDDACAWLKSKNQEQFGERAIDLSRVKRIFQRAFGLI